MRSIFVVACIFALAVSSPSADSSKKKPTKSMTPLNADEIVIYRTVLRQYVSDDRESLNVSATTYPLDSTSPMDKLADSECVKGIELENLETVAHSFHNLRPDVLPG